MTELNADACKSMLRLQLSYSARNLASGLIAGYYHNQPIFYLVTPPHRFEHNTIEGEDR
jgi:hypothetical protein